jgi:predicted anti-sigma-YlaC factor YlaD
LDPLSDYLEGDAGEDVCKLIEEHLEGCEKCRMHVDSMKRVITLYRRWRDDGIPEDVSIRLQTRLAEEAGLKKASGKKGGRPKTKGAHKPKPRS